MDHIEAKENLDLIKQMIEKTKQSHAESWRFFLLWGYMVILGILGMQALVFLKMFGLIWLNWVVFMGIGAVLQIVMVVRQERSRQVRTFVDAAVAHLGSACGVAFLFTGFVLPMLDVYPVGAISIMVSVVAGVAVFVLGGIYEEPFIKWCGVAWWLGALGMVFIHWHYRSLVVAFLVVIGYLAPGYFLHSRYKKGELEHGD
jgi:hypothetical protein